MTAIRHYAILNTIKKDANIALRHTSAAESGIYEYLIPSRYYYTEISKVIIIVETVYILSACKVSTLFTIYNIKKS